MNKEESIRNLAAHYLFCFNKDCPRHESCLHWLTGQYADSELTVTTCVNPQNSAVKANMCIHYRENKTVEYAVGMMHILDDIPLIQARSIKRRLISLFSRKRFYEYRNGTRPISPEHQQQIAQICQEEGWTGEIRYDDWLEDYLW